MKLLVIAFIATFVAGMALGANFMVNILHLIGRLQ
jgi:hypothetical protein